MANLDGVRRSQKAVCFSEKPLESSQRAREEFEHHLECGISRTRSEQARAVRTHLRGAGERAPVGARGLASLVKAYEAVRERDWPEARYHMREALQLAPVDFRDGGETDGE